MVKERQIIQRVVCASRDDLVPLYAKTLFVCLVQMLLSGKAPPVDAARGMEYIRKLAGLTQAEFTEAVEDVISRTFAQDELTEFAQWEARQKKSKTPPIIRDYLLSYLAA